MKSTSMIFKVTNNILQVIYETNKSKTVILADTIDNSMSYDDIITNTLQKLKINAIRS